MRGETSLRSKNKSSSPYSSSSDSGDRILFYFHATVSAAICSRLHYHGYWVHTSRVQSACIMFFLLSSVNSAITSPTSHWACSWGGIRGTETPPPPTVRITTLTHCLTSQNHWDHCISIVLLARNECGDDSDVAGFSNSGTSCVSVQHGEAGGLWAAGPGPSNTSEHICTTNRVATGNGTQPNSFVLALYSPTPWEILLHCNLLFLAWRRYCCVFNCGMHMLLLILPTLWRHKPVFTTASWKS